MGELVIAYIGQRAVAGHLRKEAVLSTAILEDAVEFAIAFTPQGVIIGAILIGDVTLPRDGYFTATLSRKSPYYDRYVAITTGVTVN